MSDNNGGCLMSLMVVGTIAVSIGSGVLAWNWVHPKSFGGAIVFLIVWSIFSYIGHLIVAGIVAAIGSNSN